MISRLLICAAALLAGCSDLPRDPEGTFDRVRSERRFTVGVAAGAAYPLISYVQRIEAATGARAEMEGGSTEPLLERLERGELDLVIGAFAPESPWGHRVSLLPPVAEQVDGESHTLFSAAARNGENAWIGLLHREATKVRAGR